MPRTLYTSDPHFGHINILNYEPDRYDWLGIPRTRTLSGAASPDDITAMNEALVRSWNAQVDDDDTVVVVGDVAMGRVAETIEYVRRLNGHKYLIMGNHDRPHPIMHKSDEQTAEWRRVYHDVGFEALDYGSRVESFDGVMAMVDHFPYEGDHSEVDRYADWRPVDTGMPLVHGHVHGLWQRKGRMYNVGVDAWAGVFQPVEKIGAYFRSIGFGK